MLCVKEDPDPRKCLSEGKEVTRCGFEFFGKVKQNCFAEFTKYFECIDHSDRQMSLKKWEKQIHSSLFMAFLALWQHANFALSKIISFNLKSFYLPSVVIV